MGLLRLVTGICTLGVSELALAMLDDMAYEVKDIDAHDQEQFMIKVQDNIARKVGHKEAAQMMAEIQRKR